MATFVLVHGAWGGAHGFRHVRRLLRAQGHEVSTPSLTGIGERVHLASPLVDLGTHIRDVVNHILYEDLRQIVLVGFSYGGFVVTGALEHIAERVQHLVYLDAFVPANGESVASHSRAEQRQKIELGQPWLVNGPVREFDDPQEAEWMAPRRTTHPNGCFTEPVYLAQPLESFPFTRTYIKATRSPDGDSGNAAFWRAAERAKGSLDWEYFEIESNHMLCSNRAEEVVGVLGEVARGC
ncbi:alpha/beta hydrolase [Piscinibacter sakaiensis]|uniref:alpha/beta hydrolase n=1 Tax=Piscinibacter sakaiensis TaxID=1547922 RepID=UPI003AB0308A